MKNKLLKKALTISPGSRKNTDTFTKEHVELVFEVLKGNITYRQAAKAMDMKHPGNFGHTIPVILGQAIRNKMITLTLK